MAWNQQLLPAEILSKANYRGDSHEPAWKRVDIPALAAAAARVGLATLGGQVQHRFADATCEAWWHNYDPETRRVNEPWPDFVVRSWGQLLAQLSRTPPDHVLIEEAGKDWPELCAKSMAERASGLWFVVYLVSKERLDEIQARSRR